MITKVVLYFDVPGQFSVEEGGEIVRDLRLSIYNFVAKTSIRSFSAVLSSGKKLQVNLLSEIEAKEKVNSGLKVKIGPSTKTKVNYQDFGINPPSNIKK